MIKTLKQVLFVLLLSCLSLSSWAETLHGKVVRIADGDTFTLLVDGHDQVRIRLDGIDAPEKDQPYGQKSKDYLASMIAGKYVDVRVMDTDRYGRTIGKVSTDEVADVNLEMIKAGYAWHYSYFNKEKVYADAEKAARAAKLGLWQDKNPINPYEWRKTH